MSVNFYFLPSRLCLGFRATYFPPRFYHKLISVLMRSYDLWISLLAKVTCKFLHSERASAYNHFERGDLNVAAGVWPSTEDNLCMGRQPVDNHFECGGWCSSSAFLNHKARKLEAPLDSLFASVTRTGFSRCHVYSTNTSWGHIYTVLANGVRNLIW